MEDSILESEEASKDLIFHYTTREAAMEHILFKKVLRLSPYSKTNDPRESKERSFVMVGDGLPSDTIYDKHFKTDFEFNTLIKQKCKLISFCNDRWERFGLSYNPWKRGFAKSRMWSQYGENHAGVCLCFSRKKIVGTIRNELKEDDEIIYQNVDYEDFSHDSISATTFSGNKLEELESAEYIALHLKKNSGGLFFKKAEDYSNENEYRIIVISNVSEYKFFSIGTSMEAVIVGERFPSVYWDLIKNLSENLGSHLNRLKWHEGKPYLSESMI